VEFPAGRVITATARSGNNRPSIDADGFLLRGFGAVSLAGLRLSLARRCGAIGQALLRRSFQNTVRCRHPQISHVKLLAADKMRKQCLLIERFGNQARNVFSAIRQVGFRHAAAVEFACDPARETKNYDGGWLRHVNHLQDENLSPGGPM